jgi:hypothetical protein
VSLLVKMDDNDDQRIIEDNIVGGNGSNIPSYT